MGEQAGLAPGTRSGLWSNMAAAIVALQPETAVIENVHGLLSSPAVRTTPEGATDDGHDPETTTPSDDAIATLRDMEPDPGIWETNQPDLFGRWAPFAETWPTSGYLHDGSVYRLRPSALLTTGSASSASPTALFWTHSPRTPPAAGRAWTRRLGAGRSRCHIRSSTSPCTDRLVCPSRAPNRRRCDP